jgi:hypothetical protein
MQEHWRAPVDAVEHIQQPLPHIGHNLAHHAKVIEQQYWLPPTGGVHCHIAGVRVSVEEAMPQDLWQPAAAAAAAAAAKQPLSEEF